MSRVVIVDDDGSERTLADGASVRWEPGTALQFGSTVSLTVLDGNLILSGAIPTSDPGVAGAIYESLGFLRVSAG